MAMHADTESVCPVCLKTIPAKRVAEGDSIYLEKDCEEHGHFRTLIWEGAPSYEEWGFSHEPTHALSDRGVRKGCPHDCADGLCGAHRQRTCCVLLEITQRCNLCCPTCFANSGAEGTDPGLDVIESWYDMLVREAPHANIQLSGGEPTVRDDVPEIIRMGREKGFKSFQLNTNGLRLAEEEGYAAKLKAAGLNVAFLQFDGVSDDVYTKLRGRGLLDIKKKAIDNCVAAGLNVVLVPVVAPGVNLHQVGDIIRFAIDRLPYVRGVHFQPISYFGRYESPTDEMRVTLPRLMKEIEEQTDGLMHADDFYGGTAEHSLCSFSGNYILNPDGTVSVLKGEETGRPKSSESCCCGGKTYTVNVDTDDAVKHTRDVVARRWGGEVEPPADPPKELDGLDALLYQLKYKRFSISAMGFMDCWSMDLERLKECYIHIVSPKGKLIPFCAYNLTNVSGDPVYRNEK